MSNPMLFTVEDIQKARIDGEETLRLLLSTHGVEQAKVALSFVAADVAQEMEAGKLTLSQANHIALVVLRAIDGDEVALEAMKVYVSELMERLETVLGETDDELMMKLNAQAFDRFVGGSQSTSVN